MADLAYKRQVFEKIQTLEQGKDIMPFVFRSEMTLGNSLQNYVFPIRTEDSVKVSATENRLNRNDRFYMTSIGMYLLRRQVGKEALDVLQTYPNVTAFPAVASQFVPSDLETLYNGDLEITIDLKKVIEQFPTQEFRVVPQTLQLAATTFSQRDSDTGMVDLPMFLKIDGTQTNEIKLTTPNFTGMKIQDETGLATIENRVVFVAKGFLIKGGASSK